MSLPGPFVDALWCDPELAADLNGDGRLDLATTDGAVVEVYLADGAGGFLPKADYAIEDDGSTWAVRAGDFDGDGDLDLAVAHSGRSDFQNPPGYVGSVSVLINQGNGVFDPYSRLDAGGLYTRDLTCADLNDDGFDDIVTANLGPYTAIDGPLYWNYGKVSVLLSRGDGTFDDAVPYNAGRQCFGVTTGDFDGDGALDVATIDRDVVEPHGEFYNGGSLSVLLGNGDGTLQAKQTTDTPYHPLDLVAADFDDDGCTDLAYAYGGTQPSYTFTPYSLASYQSNGNGTFTQVANFETSYFARDISAGDLDEDGAIDLVGHSDRVSVWLGDGDGTFGAETKYFGLIEAALLGDFDGDDHLDVLGQNNVGGLCLMRGNGDGTLFGPAAHDLEPSYGLYSGGQAVADFNGDEVADVAVVFGDNDSTWFSVLLGNGDGSLTVPPTPALTWGQLERRSDVCMADFNDDGAMDLALAAATFSFGVNEWIDGRASVLLGNGDGTFQTAQDYLLGLAPGTLHSALLDADAAPDLLAVTSLDYGPLSVAVLLNDGDGTFGAPQDVPVPAEAEAVALGDLNGDGRVDLVTRNSDSTISVLLGAGDGTFSLLGSYPSIDAWTYAPFVTGDVNRDGRADVIVHGEDSGGPPGTEGLFVLLAQAGGGLGLPQHIPASADVGTPTNLIVADVSRDGEADVVATGTVIAVLLGNGDGTFEDGGRFIGNLDTGSGTVTSSVADLNADGYPDLVTSTPSVVGTHVQCREWLSVIDSPVRSGEIMAGDTLRFTGHGDTHAGPTSFRWDFGGGRTSRLEDPGLVRFINPGVYDITFTAVNGAGVPDPVPDTLTLTVTANPGTYGDLMVNWVEVLHAITPGVPTPMRYGLINGSPHPLAAGTRVDAVYLSDDPILDAGDVLVGTTTVTKDFVPNEYTEGTIDVTLPGLGSGLQYLILSVDDNWEVLELHQLNNEFATELQVGIPWLADGVAFETAFPGNGASHQYRFYVPPNTESLRVGLDDADDIGVSELYLRSGQPATRTAFDARAVVAGQADQTISLSAPGEGVWYVLAHGASAPGSAAYSIEADVAGVALTASTPERHRNDVPFMLTLRGSGFDATTTIEIVDTGGTPYAPQRVEVDSFNQMRAYFDAGVVPGGRHHVRASEPGGDVSTLPYAIDIVAAGEPHLVFDLVLPSQLGYHTASTLYVTYANIGDAAMAAPVVFIGATQDGSEGALLTLDSSRRFGGASTASIPPGYGNSVQILASGATPGLLQPGETGRVPVYYAGWQWPYDFDYPPIVFSIGALDTTDTRPVDWASMKDHMRPDWMGAEAWEPIWATFVSQAGSTWGDYAAMLNDNADYLGRLGAPATAVDELIAFEFRQADALSIPGLATHEAPGTLYLQDLVAWSINTQPGQPISRRYEMGPLGRGWTHQWQMSIERTSGDVAVITDSTGTPHSFFYDLRTNRYIPQQGDIGTLTEGPGSTWTLLDPNGLITQFRADGLLDYLEDPNGNRITASYDAGRLTGLAHSAGQSIGIAYNAAGLIERVTDPYGRDVVYSYDAANEHLVAIETPDGLTTRYTYNDDHDFARHAISSIEYPDGSHHVYTYDTAGRLDSMSRDGGAELVTFAYGSAGTVSATAASGGIIRFHLDRAWHALRIDEPTGGIEHHQYDGQLNWTGIANESGVAARFTYDENGELHQAVDPLGGTTTIQYSGDIWRPTQLTDPRNIGTWFTYDAQGNLEQIRYADNTQESFTYDAQGLPATETNRRGDDIIYTYDPVSAQLTSIVYPDSSRADYVYDTHGNLLTATNAAGTVTQTYDAFDRLERITYPTGTYLGFTYDTGGRRSTVTDQDGYLTTYHYDAAGRLDMLTGPGDAPIVDYTYDPTGLLGRVDRGSGSYTTYGYDLAGLPLEIVHYDDADAIVARSDYLRDTGGRCTAMTTLDGTWTYEYDSLGRLIATTDPDAVRVEYYYDPSGNRTRVVDDGVTAWYNTDYVNQYVQVGDTTYTYDDDGNLTSEVTPTGTSTYDYDYESRLVRAVTPDGTWDYVYDALGNCIAVSRDGVTTDYLIDPIGLGNVVGEYDTNGDLVARYDYALGLVRWDDGAGTDAYHLFDAQGNTAAITGATGSVIASYAYDPFGEATVTGTPPTDLFGYVGQAGVQEGPGGLLFMRNRFYDPELGRFLSVDPLRYAGGDVNLYTYCLNDPVNLIDPLGTKFSCGSVEFSDGMSHSFGFTLGAAFGGSFSLNAGADVGLTASVGPGGVAGPAMNLGLASAGYGASAGAGLQAAYGFSSGISIGYAHGATQGIFCGWTWGDKEPLPPEAGQYIDLDPVGAVDPNQKLGPTGVGPQRYVGAGALLPYQIDFENDPAATAPAQHVAITDQLDADVDPTTVQLTGIGFGDHYLDVPAGSQYYATVVPMSYGGWDFEVHIEAGVDWDTREVYATFSSIDPWTGLPPDDVNIGFLPSEDGTGRGQGYLSYVVEPKGGLATGTEIRNVATIQFDFGEVIATNQVDPHDPGQGTDPAKEALVTLDADLPESQVAALAATTAGPDFRVEWTGQDGTSGVGSYDVYVSADGGAWELWLDDTDASWAFYPGAVGHTYAFYSVAADNVGHLEPQAAQADTETTVTSAFGVPAGITVDMDVLSGGTLNVTGPASCSLGIESLDPGTNPPSALFAVQVGTDAGAGWLRFVDTGGRTDVVADGTEPEWHTADDWAGKRLLGLQPDTAYTFHVRAGDGLGGASPAVNGGTYATNAAGDVNRSGLATALDYALIRAGELRGGELGADLPWCLDVDGDGGVDGSDLNDAWDRILNPEAPAPPVPGVGADALATSVAVSVPAPTSTLAQSNAPIPPVSAMTAAVLPASLTREGAPPQNEIARFQALLARFVGTAARVSTLDRDGDGDVDRDDLLAPGDEGSSASGE